MPDPQNLETPKPKAKPWEKYAAAHPIQQNSGGVKPWEKFAQSRTKATTPEVQAPPKNIDMRKEHPFFSGVAEGFGLDPQKVKDYGTLEVAREQTINMGKMMTDIIHDPLNIGKIVDAADKSLKGGEKDVWEGFKSGNTGQMQHGAGLLLSTVGSILGGGEESRRLTTTVDGATKLAVDTAKKVGVDADEAGRVAHRSTVSEVPSKIFKRKAFNDAYVHAKGLDVGKQVGQAASEVNKEIKLHSDGIASKIDTKIPSGIIDATEAGQKIMDSFRDEVKTPEIAHPALRQMVKDASETAPGQWTWEKVRQFRSSIGRSMNKVQGPQKAVLTQVYRDLTDRLAKSADKYGLKSEWDHYNELASKYHQQFGDVIDDITNAKSGHEVAQKLQSHKGLLGEVTKNLAKYGLDQKDVMKFDRDSGRIMKDQGGMKGTLFRMAYGTPMGAAAMIAGRVSGAGWLPSVAMGASVGYLSSYLVNLSRTLKLSPDVIEHMMSSRELPGRMKMGEGKFPNDSALTTTRSGGGSPSGSDSRGGGSTPQGSLPQPPPAQLNPPPAPRLPAPKTPPEETWKEQQERLHKTWETVEGTLKQGAMNYPEVTKASPSEVGREPGARPGTTRESKAGRTTKARERAAAKRAEKGATALGGGGKTLSGAGAGTEAIRAKESKEAQRRAAAPHMNVSNLQIPEMEEALQELNPDAFKEFQQGRKKGKWSDAEYIEGLKYLLLEEYEKKQK